MKMTGRHRWENEAKVSVLDAMLRIGRQPAYSPRRSKKRNRKNTPTARARMTNQWLMPSIVATESLP